MPPVRRQFTCDVCAAAPSSQQKKFVFTSGATLKAHTASQHSGVKQTCPTCHEAFSDPSNFRRHMNQKHQNASTKSWKCQVCDAKLGPRKDNAKRHLKTQCNATIKDIVLGDSANQESSNANEPANEPVPNMAQPVSIQAQPQPQPQPQLQQQHQYQAEYQPQSLYQYQYQYQYGLEPQPQFGYQEQQRYPELTEQGMGLLQQSASELFGSELFPLTPDCPYGSPQVMSQEAFALYPNEQLGLLPLMGTQFNDTMDAAPQEQLGNIFVPQDWFLGLGRIPFGP